MEGGGDREKAMKLLCRKPLYNRLQDGPFGKDVEITFFSFTSFFKCREKFYFLKKISLKFVKIWNRERNE